jgi:hypothetical protein
MCENGFKLFTNTQVRLAAASAQRELYHSPISCVAARCSLHGWATWLRRAYADVGASGRAKTASACSFVFCVARWQGLRCHCSDIQSLCRRACLIWRLPRARVGCLGAWGCLVVSVLIRCAIVLGLARTRRACSSAQCGGRRARRRNEQSSGVAVHVL